jgi:tRNA/rRNA methyltransferase
MKNMALADLVLVRPKAYPHPEATARASGADDVLQRAKVVESVTEAVADAGFVAATTSRPRDQNFRALDLHDAAVRIHEMSERGPAAVLFGAERTGLTNEEVALADEILTLPVDPDFSSLNIAQAVLIVAYEWRLSGTEGAALPFAAAIAEQAPREQLVAMFEHFERALDAAGFFRPPERRPHLSLALRAMFQRAGLTEQEVRTLRGIIAALEHRPTRPHAGPDGSVTTERSSGP